MSRYSMFNLSSGQINPTEVTMLIEQKLCTHASIWELHWSSKGKYQFQIQGKSVQHSRSFTRFHARGKVKLLLRLQGKLLQGKS